MNYIIYGLAIIGAICVIYFVYYRIKAFFFCTICGAKLRGRTEIGTGECNQCWYGK